MYSSANSKALARSIQRDYQQSAQNHRLLKESGNSSKKNWPRLTFAGMVTGATTYALTLVQVL